MPKVPSIRDLCLYSSTCRAARWKRVRSALPRPRRAGRRDGRRPPGAGGVRGGPVRAVVPELRLRADGRAGRGLLPPRRAGDPDPGAGGGARLRHRDRPHPGAPGRPLRRAAAGGLRPGQLLPDLRRTRSGSRCGPVPARSLAHRARDRDGAAPDREAVPQRRAARWLRRPDGGGDDRSGRHGHPGAVQRRPGVAERNVPPRPRCSSSSARS